MKLAVLTSGGDAPGMNAAVRTIVVAGAAHGHEVCGIQRGYQGLIEQDIIPLRPANVEGISRLGGTFLGSARCKEFPTAQGQEKAITTLKKHGIDALFVIGGNGSLTGAHVLAQHNICHVIGIPASIDNDIGHCGLAIGTDTAVNTIVEACDRISDTARAHRRAFLVEVMGRDCGFLAMRAGIAAEADAILFREGQLSNEEIFKKLIRILNHRFRKESHQTRVLILKAEGVSYPTNQLTEELQQFLDREFPGVELRATVLGHTVRGGNPSGLDRTIAQRLAYASVAAAEQGLTDIMASWQPPTPIGHQTLDPHVSFVSLSDVLSETATLLDGSSAVTQRRIELLNKAEEVMFI